MISNTMIPEAFEQTHDFAGLYHVLKSGKTRLRLLRFVGIVSLTPSKSKILDGDCVQLFRSIALDRFSARNRSNKACDRYRSSSNIASVCSSCGCTNSFCWHSCSSTLAMHAWGLPLLTYLSAFNGDSRAVQRSIGLG